MQRVRLEHRVPLHGLHHQLGPLSGQFSDLARTAPGARPTSPNARSGRPSPVTGGPFIQRRRPGPNHLLKEGNGPDAWSGPVAHGRGRVGGTITEYRPRRLHMSSTRHYRRAKPDNRHRGGLVSGPFPDQDVSDPVKPRPPWCICHQSTLLRLDADGPPGCAKCGLPAALHRSMGGDGAWVLARPRGIDDRQPRYILRLTSWRLRPRRHFSDRRPGISRAVCVSGVRPT
jgi:hypothetical protein